MTAKHSPLAIARALAQGILLSMLTASVSGVGLMALVLLISADAYALTESEVGASPMRIDECTTGSLLLRSAREGILLPAPTVDTQVDMRITGMVARVKLSQRFHNPSREWLEGVYVFPLPDQAAVDGLRMRIGERIIQGVIKERAQARKIYQQAKREGKKAALLEQQRPNMFTSQVANIAPGQDVEVEIEYQQVLHYDMGRFRLRFPSVVAPRYIPGAPLTGAGVGDGALVEFSGSGWSRDTTQVPDASHITPPVQHPAKGKINPLRVNIELQAGFPLAELKSSYHPIEIEERDGKHLIKLAAGTVPADRDFELVWTPQAGEQPRAALFTQQYAGDDYMLLMLMPPQTGEHDAQRLPREVIYVIDTSGSMGGTSIRQAKQALQLALTRLNPGDYFNIIEFNSATSQLFGQAVAWSESSLKQAQSFIQNLRAGGGTEMAAALRVALTGKEVPERVRQVIFLTDGSVGNETALFDLITHRLADSRLFTVGIGSAPNSFFMSRAARFGRGTFTYVGSVDEVAARMEHLFRKLESPLLSDINISWPGEAEIWPQNIPDLYLGEPLIVSAKAKPSQGEVEISGKRLGREWKSVLHPQGGKREAGLDKLWARDKIRDLMDSRRRGAGKERVREAVTEVALKHGLVSKYTSLVAVDVTPSRPEAQALRKSAIPSNLPNGWKYEKVFGALPRTATDSRWHMLLGLLFLMLALLSWAAMHRKTALRVGPWRDAC